MKSLTENMVSMIKEVSWIPGESIKRILRHKFNRYVNQ